MTNDNLKKAVRERMAQTGEKYTTALRAIQAERQERRLARLAASEADEGGTPESEAPRG